MKAIKSHIIITSLRSRKDGSLGFSAETPELSSSEKVAWLDLQGKNTIALFSPLDEPEDEVVEVSKEVNQKTQSQRIRATLFILWKQEGEPATFRDYYNEKTDKYIEYLKGMID